MLVSREERFLAIGAARLCNVDDWTFKRIENGDPPKTLEVIFEGQISSDTVEQGLDARLLIETTDRLLRKDAEQKAWRGGYGLLSKYHENRMPWICTPKGEVKLL